MEGGEGHEGGHHRGDACQGQVRSPPDYPSRAWKMSLQFVHLHVFVKAFVVIVVPIVI